MKPPPEIPPVVSDADDERPFWSVIIPTYKPSRRYLAETLNSVLAQDPGPGEMQIRVVDDCSPSDEVAGWVDEIGGGRVEFERRPANAGMAHNWNAAVASARGRWVHLLHQDDLVLPGFYERLREALEAHPHLGAAYVQHYLIDGVGERRRLMSQNPAIAPGVVSDWVTYVFVMLSFQTPAVVVRRDVYEAIGGFRPEFRYALDWDLWKRVAARYPIWYDPEPLACYRRHEDSASMDFFATGENMAEVRRSIELSREYLDPETARVTERRAKAHHARSAMDLGWNGLFTQRNLRMALVQFREAWRMGSGMWYLPLLMSRFCVGVGRYLHDGMRRHGDLPAMK